MQRILLTQGKHAIVSDADYERVNQFKWCYDAHNHCAVRAYKDNGKNVMVLMHRFIADTPIGMDTDHINGDRLDNRRSNLRICNHSDNRANSKKYSNNKSGYKGVSWDKKANRWVARLKLPNKYLFLGTFDSVIEAAKAYDKNAIKFRGKFARINGV